MFWCRYWLLDKCLVSNITKVLFMEHLSCLGGKFRDQDTAYVQAEAGHKNKKPPMVPRSVSNYLTPRLVNGFTAHLRHQHMYHQWNGKYEVNIYTAWKIALCQYIFVSSSAFYINEIWNWQFEDWFFCLLWVFLHKNGYLRLYSNLRCISEKNYG